MTPEQKKAYNAAYYAERKERFRVEALARYHDGKHLIDRVARSAYHKKWRAENPEKARGSKEVRRRKQIRKTERYHIEPAFRAKILERQKVRSKNNPLMIRKTNLKKKYNLSIEDYEKMIVAQQGKCAICDLSSGTGKDTRTFLHVDHCHDTKKVRGLLCQKCNRALGLLNDNSARLRRAADYLDRSRNT